MSESRAQMLTHIANQTGLARETVKDLMKKGWTYERHIGRPAAFVSPMPKGSVRNA